MQDHRDLLIFPYNGNGIEALDCVGSAYRFIGFVDDTPAKWGIDRHGYRVFSREAFDQFPDAYVLSVPGSPASYRARGDVIRGLAIPETRFATVIHPAAVVSPTSDIGCNVLVMAGVVITSSATVGSHVCILPNTVIHHDVVLRDWCLVGSNVTLAGGVVVEENCYIGSGSSVMNGINIGAGALIGLGSNVIRNVPPDVRVAGNPARVL